MDPLDCVAVIILFGPHPMFQLRLGEIQLCTEVARVEVASSIPHDASPQANHVGTNVLMHSAS